MAEKVRNLIEKNKIIRRLIALVLSFSLLLAIVIVYLRNSLGWFANNRNVNGQGMMVNVEASPNLVISDSPVDIANYTELGWNSSYFEKTWIDPPLELIPTDHYDSSIYTIVEGVNVFNLVYNLNPENVDRTTGKGSNLTFAHVPDDGENVFFLDRDVYIASITREMTRGSDYSTLTFSIEESGNGTTTNSAYKSASVDVYVDGDFRGTLNLDSLDSFSLTDIDTIPLNSTSSIPIILRFYFDGALQDPVNSSKNYVNSKDLAVNTANIFINIKITLE